MTSTSSAPSVHTLIDPTTGEPFTEVPHTTAAEVSHLVQQAETAQRQWAAISGDERARALWHWSELIDQRHRELAELDVRCTGKTIRDAVTEASRASRHARYWAGRADGLVGQAITDVPSRLSYTIREPLGVYAVVLPANAPTHAFAARVAPPLACGNAVVVKPAEISPLSAQLLAELATQAGMPAGLLSIAPGDARTGEALVTHPTVTGISFTGSIATGQAIARATADDFKKSIYELGGKSPVVIFEDADIDAAVRAICAGITTNAGQICAASSRLIVHEQVRDQVLAGVREAFDRLVVGDPMDPATDMGPLATAAQYQKTLSMIGRCLDAGARAIGPSGALDRPGYFVAPTIVDQVDGDMEIWRHEVFGPVLAVRSFSTEDEAVSMANDSAYGLAAYAWTRDIGRMLRITAALDAGAVHGNTALVMDSALPFGGFKSSGLGGAYGDDAAEAATRTKRITIATA